MALRIEGGRVMLATGEIVEATVTVEDGAIAGIGEAASRAANGHTTWDATGLLVLPGIVDLHGDAFERQIMPRPGVHFPMDVAFRDTDRQLVANGITTAYHGVTYSWEPGLRGRQSVIEIREGLEAVGARLAADARFHLRFETYNLDAVDEVAEWIEGGTVDLLAFNDHLTTMAQKARRGDPLAVQTGRAGMGRPEFVDLIDSLVSRGNEVAPAMARLADLARANGVPMASHDDRLPAERRHYESLGARIAEFPLTTEASETAKELGDAIILGAPNVVRGGSHLGDQGISAAREVAAGRCTVLVSDYYYPALPQAPFLLARQGSVGSVAEGWRLVSTAAAEAANLADRGAIEVGRRADLVLVEDPGRDAPVEVVATLVAGRPVHQARAL